MGRTTHRSRKVTMNQVKSQIPSAELSSSESVYAARTPELGRKIVA